MSVKNNEIIRDENEHAKLVFAMLFEKMLEICHTTTLSFDELVEMEFDSIEKALDYFEKTYKEQGVVES